MFEGQPKGLYALALANTGERFGYYTMLAVFVLFLQDNFGWGAAGAGAVYSSFLMLVYFLPFIGGILADKFGYGKMVTLGIILMFLGYVFLSIPLGSGIVAIGAMFAALLLVSIGTGLFKGNLQVMVGNLYDAPQLQNKRDSAFSIFYMAINIGALFAPTAATSIMDYAQKALNYSKADSYHFAFAVACVSLILSIAIYYAFRSTFRNAEGRQDEKGAKDDSKSFPELSKKETKDRIIALCLVFAVVVFFWMSFHQNGLTLTYFANEYTETMCSGMETMLFDIFNLVLVIIAVYALFSVFQSRKPGTRVISLVILLLSIGVLVWKALGSDGAEVKVEAPIFQQFNPFYVVALTPVSLALFGWLAKKGKEPSAPRKIGLGMLVAAIGFLVMTVGSIGLITPIEQAAAGNTIPEASRVSPNWLIVTYLVLTFGELLLSPMGISFVSKVSPPKYKGMMMGGWFVATAIGNFLTVIPALLWGNVPLPIVWGVLVVLCLVSAIFIFSVMKRLEKVC